MTIASGSDALSEDILQSLDSTGKLKEVALGLVFKTPSLGALPVFHNSQSTGYISASTSGLFLMSLGAQAPDYRTVQQSKVKQYVVASTTAVVSCTVSIPFDDTPPLQTEGNQVLEASITPSSPTNYLCMRFHGFGTENSTDVYTVALFQDAINSAIQAVPIEGRHVELDYAMIASTSASTTFKIRTGGTGSDPFYYNADHVGGRYYGGVSKTLLEIWEVEP